MSPRIPFKYIGWLSRFQARGPGEKKYDVMAIVSGPEPQRTGFEKLLRRELSRTGIRALLVTGQPTLDQRASEGSIDVVSHLPANEMEFAILASEVIIARSGYSTVMDLITLGKRAAFVPTPQQPEQIFLGRFLHHDGVAYCADQENFVLESAMRGAREFKGLGAFSKQDGLLEEQIKRL